jgi:hypothetical protein
LEIYQKEYTEDVRPHERQIHEKLVGQPVSAVLAAVKEKAKKVLTAVPFISQDQLQDITAQNISILNRRGNVRKT